MEDSVIPQLTLAYEGISFHAITTPARSSKLVEIPGMTFVALGFPRKCMKRIGPNDRDTAFVDARRLKRQRRIAAKRA